MDFLPVDVFSPRSGLPLRVYPSNTKKRGVKAALLVNHLLFFLRLRAERLLSRLKAQNSAEEDKQPAGSCPFCSWMRFARLPRRPSVAGRACT